MKLNQISRTIAGWPNRLAVVQNDIRWTYGDLGDQSYSLRFRLQEAGLAKGNRAVIWLNNCAQYIATYLAVLDIEGVVVALHPRSPISEIVRAIRQVGATCLITTDKSWRTHRKVLEQSGVAFALLPEDTVFLSKDIKEDPAPEGLAQLCLSGTAGDRGVAVLHQSDRKHQINSRLSAAAAWMQLYRFFHSFCLRQFDAHLFAGPNRHREQLVYQLIVDRMKKVTGFRGGLQLCIHAPTSRVDAADLPATLFH
jgi:acyl-CoA synthetase (AMP-forming)/AMP-acid ligase II